MKLMNEMQMEKVFTAVFYKDISEIQMQPWGAKMCTINTPDGYALRFFE